MGLNIQIRKPIYQLETGSYLITEIHIVKGFTMLMQGGLEYEHT